MQGLKINKKMFYKVKLKDNAFWRNTPNPQTQLFSKKVIQFIDNELGDRGNACSYNYSDIVRRVYTAFCGGNAIEDVNYIKST